MARLEIPSIVVHNGSSSPPSSPPAPHREDPPPSEGEGSTSPGGHIPISNPSPEPRGATGGAHGGPPSVPTGDNHPCVPTGPGPGGGEEGFSPRPSPTRSRSLDLPNQHLEGEASAATQVLRNRMGNKQKQLQRSHAMREDASPPPPDLPLPPLPLSHCGGNSLTVSPTIPLQGGVGVPVAGRRRLRHQGSSQGSFEGSSPCLSRESSMEYTDSSGVDLLQFIVQTLHKHQKDRAVLLKIERELVNLVKDNKRSHHKFQQMSSYHRMLVHRCAAYFGLEHNVDQAGTAVIVNKTKNTRLPETRFREHVCDDMAPLPDDLPRRGGLRREFSSFEDSLGFKADMLSDPRRSKSFEERQEEYQRARKRMFSQESFSSLEGGGSEPRFGGDRCRGLCHEEHRWRDRHCWHFADPPPPRPRHFYDTHRLRPGRLPKVESLECTGARALKPSVFKSHSFGGYSGGVTVLTRGDSLAISERLTKQDSTSSRLSEQSGSSGYKTQRQDTSSTNVSNTLSTTPSPVTSHHHHSSLPPGGVWGEGGPEHVMWAVTDMDAVPAGAVLINPQTGQPFVNQDGTVYRYDPSNPPHLSAPHPPPPPSQHHSPLHHHSPHHHHCQHDGLVECEMPSQPQQSPYYPLTPSPPREGLISSPLPTVPTGDAALPAEGSGEASKTSSNEEENSSSPTTVVACAGGPPSARLPKGHEAPGGTPSPPASAAGSSPPPTAGGGAAGGSRSAATLPRAGGHSCVPSASAHYQGQECIRTCSVDSGLNEAASQLRGLSLSASDVASEAHPQAYLVPRHYPQAVYYVQGAAPPPACGGAIKYIYPPPPPAVQGAAGAMGLMGAGSPSAVCSVPTALPPTPTAVDPSSMTSGTGGSYLPGGFSMLGYPGGVVGASGRGGPPPTVQESGGTTYYCPVQPPTAPLPPPPSSIAPAPLHQYSHATGASPLYPQLVSSLGYYGGGSVYQSPTAAAAPAAGAAGAMYAAAAGGGPSVHATAPHQGYTRAPTPPHSTQAVGLPLGLLNNPTNLTMLPHQPHTPSSHHHLITTFFRPNIQVVGSASETTPPPPPPPPVLQYSSSPMTPHPPVFGKPYLGASISPLVPAPQGESSSPTPISRDFPKRHVGAQSFPTPAGVAKAPPPHVVGQSYCFRQNEIPTSSRGGLGGVPPTYPSRHHLQHHLQHQQHHLQHHQHQLRNTNSSTSYPQLPPLQAFALPRPPRPRRGKGPCPLTEASPHY